MIFLTRAQGLKLQGYFRSKTTDQVAIETSPTNPGNVQITVWETTARHQVFELTPEGRKVGRVYSH